MMGSNDKPQNELFYAFNLEDHVPQDHLLRSIDRFLDFAEVRQHLTPYYSHTGRPSVDPELMIRMLLIGYCLGIRSERQLCEEINLNLAYRWFCRLSITDKVPDHSTFSKNRHGRFRESEAFRFVFEQVIKRCMREGLISGEGFAVDASVVKADASRQRHHDDDDAMTGVAAVEPSTSIWMPCTRKVHRSLRRRRSRRPTRWHAGRPRRVARRTMPTQPTIWWIPRPVLSWMSRRRPHTARRKSGRRRP